MEVTATLSSRESQIIEMIAAGFTKKEIGSKLDISERTVENHTRNAMKKVKCKKSTELVRWHIEKTLGITINKSIV